MSQQNLESLLKSAGNTVDMLRNSRIGAYVYPVVPSEFYNWRDEQRAWRETAVLFDQTHHMAELTVKGPDALKLISYTTINSFNNFAVEQGQADGARQLRRLCHRRRHPVLSRQGRAAVCRPRAVGELDAISRRDRRLQGGPDPRRPLAFASARQGGDAAPLSLPDAGTECRQSAGKAQRRTDPRRQVLHHGCHQHQGPQGARLRHGMAGAPGLEIWGPYAEGDEIRDAILEAGQEFGLVPVGSRAYASNTLESGWIPSPLPAVYTGEKMKKYREWLPAGGYEGTGSIGGSFVSKNIEDYYMTPYELGYGPFVKFDHDFIGREALEKMAKEPHRKKVTFAWNGEDCGKIYASLFMPGTEHYKFLDLPIANYASSSYDKVMMGGKVVGLSMFGGYSYNERSVLSLGVVDPDIKTATCSRWCGAKKAAAPRRPRWNATSSSTYG